MTTLFCCFLFSNQLNLDGLTMMSLLSWFNSHPFLAILTLLDFGLGLMLLGNLLTSLILSNSEEDCDCCSHDKISEALIL